ncbi:MAG: ParB [Devosia sp.]|nr:ParB [Devosia sp.]
MNDKPSRLGRGLAALIGDMAPTDSARGPEAGVRRVPLAQITANRQNPRRDFAPEALAELANSIREKGIMQPLLVRPAHDDPQKYEIIAGERRWRAAQQAGLHEVPVIVRDVGDKEALELAIIENVQRADLNPVEESQGYDQLMQQFGYTQQDLAQVIGKSRSHVANTLRLMKLPTEVLEMLARGELSAGHARTLITAEDPVAMAWQIVSAGLSVRQAESLNPSVGVPRRRRPAGVGKDTDTLAVEKRLSDALGLTVTLHHQEGSGGKMEIRYRTLEQLDDVCQRLGV